VTELLTENDGKEISIRQNTSESGRRRYDVRRFINTL
jgi:hypothetical protein